MLTEEEWAVLELVAPRKAWRNESHLCAGNQAAYYSLCIEREDGSVRWFLKKWAFFDKTGAATGQSFYTLTRSQGWLEITAGEVNLDQLGKAFKGLDLAEESFSETYYG